MSDTCGNCDCADKSQCVKKGSSYAADFVETEKSTISTDVMEVQADDVMEVPADENDGKCGSNCT